MLLTHHRLTGLDCTGLDWTDGPKPICPLNFFEVGGIINKDEITMGGDFNCVESHKLDRNENTQYTADASLKSYFNLKDKRFLSDIWRVMQSRKKQFTYLKM